MHKCTTKAVSPEHPQLFEFNLTTNCNSMFFRYAGSVLIGYLALATAFAPSSSFMGRSKVIAAPRTSTSTALQMNLFDRFQRVAKANLNNILQNLEDPEKIMSQALEDMQVRTQGVD